MARKNTEKLKANLALLKERFPNVFYDTKPLIPTIRKHKVTGLARLAR